MTHRGDGGFGAAISFDRIFPLAFRGFIHRFGRQHLAQQGGPFSIGKCGLAALVGTRRVFALFITLQLSRHGRGRIPIHGFGGWRFIVCSRGPCIRPLEQAGCLLRQQGGLTGRGLLAITLFAVKRQRIGRCSGLIFLRQHIAVTFHSRGKVENGGGDETGILLEGVLQTLQEINGRGTALSLIHFFLLVVRGGRLPCGIRQRFGITMLATFPLVSDDRLLDERIGGDLLTGSHFAALPGTRCLIRLLSLDHLLGKAPLQIALRGLITFIGR